MNQINKSPLEKLSDLTENIQMRSSSIEAFEKIKPERHKHYDIILKSLRYLKKDSTAKVIASVCILSYHQIQRRLSEMETKGMIKVVGRCPEVKGRPNLWSIVKKTD